VKLSELIAAHGDERVRFQKLDDCVTDMQMTKQGTRASFVAPETMGLDGFDRLGLIVWLDRDRVRQVLAGSAVATAREPDGA
jgi:hypothetical protein